MTAPSLSRVAEPRRVRRTREADAAAAAIVTPSVGRSARRAVFWLIAALALVTLGLGMLLFTGATAEADRFGADESAPSGSRALVEVLRDEGVDVVVVSSLDDAVAAAAVADAETTTILAADPRALVDPKAWPRLDGVAARLVLVEPGPEALSALVPDVFAVDLVDGERQAGCAVPLAERSGTVEGTGLGYDSVAADAEVCFDGDGGAVLVTVPSDGGDGVLEVSVLGAATLLQNDTIARQGNAALALGLLGEHPRLVWWVGGLADADPGALSIAELTPGWVNPLAWLALTVGLAAAVWRGRRLGPVVVENLPVVVRTTETMEGRARLYARAGARLRALDALRLGTLRRLGEQLGLGATAGLDEIIASTAAATGRSTDALRALLVGSEPGTDRELVDLSDELAALESLVHRRVGLDDTAGDATSSAAASVAGSAPGTSHPAPTRRMDR